MPVFWFLVVLGLVLFWALISGLYRPIGNYFIRIINDCINAMKGDEEDE